MAARKLRQFEKEMLVNLLISHKFDKLQDKLLDRELKLGQVVYNELYTAKCQHVMASFPDGFFPVQSTVRVRFGGADADRFTADWNDDRRIAHMHQYGTVDYAANHLLGEKFRQLKADQQKLDAEKKDATRKIYATLKPITTVGALLKQWPDIAPFLDRVVPREKKASQLPVVPIKTLNKLLDLPV